MDKMNFFESNEEHERFIEQAAIALEKVPDDLIRSLALESTSKGMHRKFVLPINGKDYYIKLGTYIPRLDKYSPAEPVIECIVYRIGAALGFDCAEYYLSTVSKDRLGTTEDCLVSISPSFLPDDSYILISMNSFLKSMKRRGSESNYMRIINSFPQIQEDIDKMIVFDYLFNNTDRHFNNFGLIQCPDESIRFAPLYDHGLCLYGSEPDTVFLYERNTLWNYEAAKPFRKKHSEAIKLVKSVSSLSLNLDIALSEVFSIFDSYSSYIIPERMEEMKSLFERRFQHVRSLRSDEQG